MFEFKDPTVRVEVDLNAGASRWNPFDNATISSKHSL